jgi:hypothetical protein
MMDADKYCSGCGKDQSECICKATLDLTIPLTKDEWQNLNDKGEAVYPELLKRTRYEEEHPDWYDGPCECQMCCSYGD